MKQQKTVESRVLEILKECPMSRYDDMLLILHYYNQYGYIPAGNLPLEDIVFNYRAYGLPCFETIRRARQRVTVEWNGVPASYHGVLTNAGILKADLFRNLQVVWTVQTGLSQTGNGKAALMNQRQEMLSSSIGKATVQQTTLVS